MRNVFSALSRLKRLVFTSNFVGKHKNYTTILQIQQVSFCGAAVFICLTNCLSRGILIVPNLLTCYEKRSIFWFTPNGEKIARRREDHDF